jgi:uncharacterized membrane protein
MERAPDPVLPRKFKIAFLVVALLGFLDASYLTMVHYLHIIPPCYIVQGCETVTTSAYSKILGIPVALLGALYYLTVFSLMLFYADKREIRVLPFITGATVLGFLSSLWFLYVQGVLIGEWCMYCLFSALTSSILFAFGLYVWKRRKRALSLPPTY